MLYRIDNKKLFMACAAVCLSVTEVVVKGAGCSSLTLQRITEGKPVTAVTIGKICRSLGIKPADIIAE